MSGRAQLRVVTHVGIGAVACALAWLFVAHEQPAYRWDYGNYFHQFIDYGQKLATSPWGWVAAARYAIAHLDYNPTSILPLSPLYAALGGSRAVYVMALIALYAIPAAWVAATMAKISMGRADECEILSPFVGALALLYWPLYIAALRGMPDVVGTIPLGVATILILTTRYLSRASLRQAIIVGVLVWSAFLLRRWYAYAGVALVAATGGCCFAALLAELQSFRNAVRITAERMAAVGLTIGFAIILFQLPLALRVLGTSYGDIYAPYQSSLRDDVADLYDYTGPALSALMLLGIARALRTGGHQILFCTALAILTFLLFTRVQGFGEQHILPIFFWLFPTLAYGAVTLCDLARRHGRIAATAIVACVTLSFLSEFAPPVRSALVSPALPRTTTFPLQVEHYAAYLDLIKTIKTSLGPGEKVSVIASGEDLSASFLDALDPAVAATTVAVADVDTRDGLRLPAFDAAYALVTDPPALHLAPQFQRNISVPVADILVRRGFGAAYERVAGPFLLGGGLRAFLYRRTRPMTPVEKDDLIGEMRAFYPQWTLRSDGTLYVPDRSQRSR